MASVPRGTPGLGESRKVDEKRGEKKHTAGKQDWKDTQEDEEEDCSHGCRSARLQRSASNVSMLTFFFFFVFVHLRAGTKTMLLCERLDSLTDQFRRKKEGERDVIDTHACQPEGGTRCSEEKLEVWTDCALRLTG